MFDGGSRVFGSGFARFISAAAGRRRFAQEFGMVLSGPTTETLSRSCSSVDVAADLTIVERAGPVGLNLDLGFHTAKPLPFALLSIGRDSHARSRLPMPERYSKFDRVIVRSDLTY